MSGHAGHRNPEILVPSLPGPAHHGGTSGGFVFEGKAVHSDFWWDLAGLCEVCTEREIALCSALISVKSLTLSGSFLSSFLC